MFGVNLLEQATNELVVLVTKYNWTDKHDKVYKREKTFILRLYRYINKSGLRPKPKDKAELVTLLL